MKKILFFVFFVVINGVTLSQSIVNQNNEEVVLLTKEKHDALRKDIEDYRNLLIKYQSIKVEYETLMFDLNRQTLQSGKTLEELKKANGKIETLELEIDYLKNLLDELSKKNEATNKNYLQTSRLYYQEKNKVHTMKKHQGELWAWRFAAIFSFISIFIVSANH